jgi:hypothetical protein
VWAIGDGVGLVGTGFVMMMHEPAAVVVTSSCLGDVDLIVKPLTLTPE